MNNHRFTQIGFSQRVQLEWLERTANLVLAGNEKAAINASLQELLQDKVSVGGQAVRGNREKIITILLKTWLTVPADLCQLRDDGLRMLRELPPKDHLAVHWGMVQAAYPFWSCVAAQTGKLLRLQGTVAAAQVQRRVREHYGERETVARAARRVLRSFIDWEVLTESAAKGVYSPASPLVIGKPQLTSWLIEAQLHADPSGRAPFNSLTDAHCLFPFRFEQVGCRQVISISDRLELLPDGSSNEIIGLRALSASQGKHLGDTSGQAT